MGIAPSTLQAKGATTLTQAKIAELAKQQQQAPTQTAAQQFSASASSDF